MNENKKYEVVKKLVDTNGNKKNAVAKLGYTIRHINRLIVGYKKYGKEFFVHGNTGRKPVTTIPETTKQLILDLYRTKYYNCNFTHYAELLNEYENINVSVSTINSILRKKFFSPKTRKSTKKLLKKNWNYLNLSLSQKKRT